MRAPDAPATDGSRTPAARVDDSVGGPAGQGVRPQGPADLRLVAPALAAWATAAWALEASPAWVTGVVAVCLSAAGALLIARRAGARGGAGGRRRSPGSWPAVSVAAALLCAAAAGLSAGLHGADLRRGPVPALARAYAQVTADLEVSSDPRLSRPGIKGDHVSPTAVLFDAEVRRLTRTDGTVTATRAPVLVIVDTASRAVTTGSPAVGDGPRRSPWQALLPSTRVRVAARLAPPLTAGHHAAVLRVRAGQPPDVVGEPSPVQRWAGRLRAGLREATDGLDPDARALLPGLVVGDTSRVPPDLDDAFRKTDLAHLLAVSGGNFTLLLALFIGPVGLAQRAERRGPAPWLGIPLRGTALLGGTLTLGFVIVCRPDPSVLRAAACGAIALLALATGRRRTLIPALATAVLLLVLYDPWLARSYGFLLSVLATGALLTLAPRWSAALRRRGVPSRAAEALAAAASAQALCAPVVVLLSARVSLVAVPCNLLAELAVAPATVLGFAALAAAPMAMPVAEVCAWGAGRPAGWIAGIARTGAALPGGGVDWPGSWAGALLLAAVTVIVVLVGRRLLRRPWQACVCAAVMLLVVVRPPPLTRVITGWPPPGWRFAMCDVGQGDATVLAAGPGTGVVVDAGPDPALVDRCLAVLGITRVPLVVLTHFHADHVMGLPGVLRGRSVGAIETTWFEEPREEAAFVRAQAAARRIPVTRAVAGEHRRTGALDWRVVWPPPGPQPLPGSRLGPSRVGPMSGEVPPSGPPLFPDGPNDASVALLARSAGLTLLLLGDLEPPSQQALLRSPAGAALGPVDVLKVAHHGSAFQDPELLRRVAPRLALISCGRHNLYGHPAPGTVARLRSGGALVLRTDEDGAVAVAGEGRELRVARD
ncbi:ComEC/Rec2 family competence protein [Streptomyces sp. NPDC007264]|uniref:ComEC/Rec2 family competence protein n=1 Tax=Streptomyces sp. NPDC007264 TaxID=3364777 RepID=UPI0036DDD8BC